MEGDTVRGLSAHSFRVGLTQDLFAAGEDGSGIALALRWSSPTTALRYARELAVGNTAAARVLGRLRDSEAPTVARSTAHQRVRSRHGSAVVDLNSVVLGTSVSERVEPGGSRTIKQKKHK